MKRSIESSEVEITDVSWRQLLGYDAAQENSLESERLKNICVVGAGKLGSSLAESLASKPGLALVAVHMSIGGKDAKFEIMPVYPPPLWNHVLFLPLAKQHQLTR